MKRYTIPMTIIAMLLFFAGVSFAEIRVVSVKGTASYKAGGQWVPLAAGAALAVGTKVSTGVRSTAVLKINRHTLTVQPLTIMKISTSVETDKSSTTNIGLRRGSVRAKVDENARIKTVFKVSTPVATSSVRGCEKTVKSGPMMGMTIVTHRGITLGTGLNAAPKVIPTGLQFQQNPDTGAPESPMAALQENLTNTNPKFLTADEQAGTKVLGNDFLDYQGGGGMQLGGAGAGGQNQITQIIQGLLIPANTGVTIVPTWPQ